MYTEKLFPERVLIVKLSSLGDILQSLSVLEVLKKKNPRMIIEWASEEKYANLLKSHPYIDRVVSVNRKRKGTFFSLRHAGPYDVVFDLQGNTKSGLITFLSRGKIKVGYDRKTVREWPNLLATNARFFVSKGENIRTFYTALIERFFNMEKSVLEKGALFRVSEGEKKRAEAIFSSAKKNLRIMVCPGSFWPNKQLEEKTLKEFLEKIDERYHPSFFLIAGNEKEEASARRLKEHLGDAHIQSALTIPLWQNLMAGCDLIIACDSSALHLSAATETPSFSIFGPTSAKIFAPPSSFTIQGTCPYGESFVKQCPFLRSCKKAPCIKSLSARELFAALQNRYDSLLRGAPRGFLLDHPRESLK